MKETYRVAGPDIVHESFGGDVVVLNLRSGQYFGLNASGAELWSAIVAGQDVGILGCDDDPPGMVSGFAAKLCEHGLIVADDSAGDGVTTTPILLTGQPMIEVYDDLSDLIVADPIHDVEAAMGWPKLPASE